MICKHVSQVVKYPLNFLNDLLIYYWKACAMWVLNIWYHWISWKWRSVPNDCREEGFSICLQTEKWVKIDFITLNHWYIWVVHCTNYHILIKIKINNLNNNSGNKCNLWNVLAWISYMGPTKGYDTLRSTLFQRKTS